MGLEIKPQDSSYSLLQNMSDNLLSIPFDQCNFYSSETVSLKSLGKIGNRPLGYAFPRIKEPFFIFVCLGLDVFSQG